MKKKQFRLGGTLKRLPKKQIYLNVNHLDNGAYVLKIIHKNKLIKKTTFYKNKE
ncbi:MAG: hypothetical protein OEQ81_05580 [Flavobacteriaceae bacterium]|nr:hypothetical protein [Flavobacteriaceae bacterium]